MGRHLGAACLAALLSLSTAPARAAAPTDTLRDFFARVNGLIQAPEAHLTLAERLARLRRMTQQVFDTRRAAAEALGKDWATHAPAEQEEFADLFGDVLERGYLALVGSKAKIEGGVTVRFIDEVLDGDNAVVRTALKTRGNSELLIDYLMSPVGSGWRVVDAAIGGVSLVANYRAQIMHIRQRATYRELIAQMRTVVGAVQHPRIAVAETVTSNATSSAQASPRAAAVAADSPAGVAPPPEIESLCRDIGDAVPTSGSLPLNRFWVQVGAFADAESVVRLVERLGESAMTIVTPPAASRASAPLTWVCVGPFAEDSAALVKAREVDAAGYHASVAAQLPHSVAGAH